MSNSDDGVKFPDLDSSNADHSAATTETSSPRPFCDGEDMMNSMPSKWEQVRESLVNAALDGNENLQKYGDMITCRETVERFLAGAKGNVEKAAKQLEAHLEWRREYKLDDIVNEDFSDLEARKEIYWGGTDLQGVPTLTWLIGKHLPSNQCPKRFVRFFVYQIERGLRTSPKYPNAMFNIFVELTDAGFHSIDGNVAALLQPILMKNYPKVRKGMFVFPVNWFVQLCWNTVLKPLISSLQPDIEDKICPLYGDYRPQLFARFSKDQVELAFGGTLDIEQRKLPDAFDYKSVSLKVILESERRKREATVSALHAAKHLTSEKLVLLESDARAVVRKKRKSYEFHGRTEVAALIDDEVHHAEDASLQGKGQSILYYVSLLLLVSIIWNGVTMWASLGLGIIIILYLSTYINDRKGGADWKNKVTADNVIVYEWANPALVDRDTTAIMSRLEEERMIGKSTSKSIQRVRRSISDRLSDAFCDYAKRCGI